MPNVTLVRAGIGSGIYTFQEAARLLRVSTAQVRGWGNGYVYSLHGEGKRTEPVLHRRDAGLGLLTFHDLVELFFVREFRRAGVELGEIRETARLLAERLNTPYPFADCRLDTDGVQILLAAGDHYENVARQQGVFRFVEEFFKDLDFEECLAERWWPLGREKLVVVDPRRAFGSPVEFKSGVRTDVIYSTYRAEGDVQLVADWYEVPREAVEAAVEFEERWKLAA